MTLYPNSKDIMKETIQITYLSDKIDKLTYIEGKSDWIDLRSAVHLKLKAGEFALVNLGIGMILPDGFEAHLAPRSSTFKNFGILVPNSPGIIDNSYCGENDEWKLPVLAMRDTEILVNDRICQFRLVEKQPAFVLKETLHLSEDSRGGFGSTGRN